ncbi:STAS domain-containing protein [Streptomyces sp. NPDC049813]|uniref:STAS domain-containing protein n=1 Tax=Streptomyces sp. NPDC049813 TaxID=3365597 RepID=UPI0037A6B27C
MPDRADGALCPATGSAYPGPAVRTSVREEGTHTHLAVKGEVDLDSAQTWEQDLYGALNDSRQGLVLDLRALRFCDCAGLNALLRVRRAALRTGKTVTIDSAGPAVTRLLHLTRTAALFTTAPAVGLPGAPVGQVSRITRHASLCHPRKPRALPHASRL